jgi:hypothetical protein
MLVPRAGDARPARGQFSTSTFPRLSPPKLRLVFFVGWRVSITCKGACFSSFRECSHYGPPETLFAFGKRLIPATQRTMQYYIRWTWFSDHASMVETLA